MNLEFTREPCLVTTTSYEIDVSEQELNDHFELIKIIKRYEFCSGWTVLIAPDHLPKKEVLKRYGVNLDKVLIIHKKHCTDVLFAAHRGLLKENCSALVIWDEIITKSELALLKAKANSVNTALYLLNKNHNDLAVIHH